MCGIAGIMAADGGELNQPVLRAMTAAIAHRGPDGDGFYYGPKVGLGHRRLSIIDIDGGAQPMSVPSKDVILTYNGEIYNFQSLKRELEALGHVFTTRCDTEVLLMAYMEWGRDCVSRFRGMFAFAIWDNRRHELFLARDRLGIKPLYYSVLTDGSFAFASEIKGLLAHPNCPKRMRLDALEDYLALGYVPDPKSLIDGIYTLPPASTMVKKEGSRQLDIQSYWSPPIVSEGGITSNVSELVERLEEAVKLRMISDVPLGAFLSGGVDSSAIVAMMSRNSDAPVETCSIGSEDPDFDESGYADIVARHFNTSHRLRLAYPDDTSLMSSLAEIYDDPFADLSALPTYRVCALARERVTVSLSGDGGDELFAGYRRHRFHMMEEQLRGQMPLSLRKLIFKPLGTLYPKMDRAPQFLRAKSTFEALARSSAEAYCHSVGKTPDRDRKLLHSAILKKRLAGYHPHERFRELADEVKGADPLSIIQYIDLKTYLPGDILTKVDRASMAHSLEVRVPILDHKFVEYALRLPPEGRIVDGEGKANFKKALEGTLPDNILYREKKGFVVPVADWLRGSMSDDLEQLKGSEILYDTGLISHTGVTKMIDEHQQKKRDHHTSLWSLIMLERSLEHLQLDSAA